MLNLSPVWKRRLLTLFVLVVIIGAVLGFTVWYKFFRQVDDGPFKTAEERFLYGSIDAENTAGLPYWIWVALPRVFPDLLPRNGQGGYRALRMAWCKAPEMPTGVTKKRNGFPRGGNNCAICHHHAYRTTADETPRIIAVRPDHTVQV